SAVPLAGERLRAWREAGVQGHFQKPFEPADLAALVERLAGGAVERRRGALYRRQWPRDVSHDRRAEVRGDGRDAWWYERTSWYQRGFSSGSSTGPTGGEPGA